MKLHDVRQKAGTRQPRKRVGRGRASGTGKTSGRGHKGAKSRSGYKHKAAFEGGQMPLVRRIPKRGFSNYPFRKAWAEVNLTQLARFSAGSTVDPEILTESGLVKGNFDGIVILGRGELEGALTVKAHRFSKSAAAKIEAAGGTVEIVPLAGASAEAAEAVADDAVVEDKAPVAAEAQDGQDESPEAAEAEEIQDEAPDVTEPEDVQDDAPDAADEQDEAAGADDEREGNE